MFHDTAKLKAKKAMRLNGPSYGDGKNLIKIEYFDKVGLWDR